MQEPVSQQLASQEPVSQQLASQEPAGQEPAGQEPAGQEPVSQEPVSNSNKVDVNVVVLNDVERFFSDNIKHCIPERISRNKFVTQNLFIKHPELFYADQFGENPNLTDSYLESKINELNFTWLSTTCHVEFLLKHPERIVWSAAALNEAMPKDILLTHEDQFDLRVCDNSNFDEAYFSSRIARELPIDGNRLCMNKSISPEWLDKHGLLNWYWIGYNLNVDPQFFRDNYNKIKFSTYAFNKNADFTLIDRYITQQTEQLKILHQKFTSGPANEQANQSANEQANQSATQQANQPATQQANQQANQPANEQANQSANQQANQQATQQAMYNEIKEDLLLTMEAACYNPAVPEWFLNKWCDLVVMDAVASNSGVSFEYLKANISRVPLNAMSYNSNVPYTWHMEHFDHIVWHSLCMKLSQ